MKPKTLLCSGFCGATVAALCCFTSLGVLALGAVGLGMLVPGLDFAALPALVIFIAMAVLGGLRWQRQA